MSIIEVLTQIPAGTCMYPGTQSWRSLTPSQLTPMFSQGLCHFYIEELSQLKDGTYVIPHCWIVWKKELHADCSVVIWTAVCYIRPWVWDSELQADVWPDLEWMASDRNQVGHSCLWVWMGLLWYLCTYRRLAAIEMDRYVNIWFWLR